MPGLAEKLLISATDEGLLLRTSSPKEQVAGDVRIEYGSSRITRLSRSEQPELSSSFEAHGIVGLLNLVASSHLVAITGHEQVAQIREKAIFAVRDVTLIPLTSKAEAEKAVAAALKSLKQDKAPSTTANNEGSDTYDDDAEELSFDDEGALAPGGDDKPTEAAALESPKAVAKKKTATVKNIVQDPGRYGRFATRWFTKGGRSADRRTKQDLGSEEDQISEQHQATGAGAEEKEANDEEGKEEDVTTHADEKANTSPSSKSKTAIDSLTPRILRSAKLFFSTSGFFFSYDHDISGTLTQRSTLTGSVPLWERFDSLYFWNRNLLEPFVNASLDELCLPLMQGFVGQRAFSIAKTEDTANDVVAEAAQDAEEVVASQPPTSYRPTPPEVSGDHDFLLTLISRRSVRRAGLRYLRRGCDDDGNVANAVETEQLLSSRTWGASDRTFALLQTRGSIPLHFSQSPYSFKPTPVMYGSETTNQSALRKHFTALSGRYGQIQVASLIDRHGPEVSIGEAYQTHAKKLNDSGGVNGKALGFEWFDFHSACKGMKFENVSILIDSLETNLKAFGWIEKQNDRNTQLQKGILRTNCMDCLDRTNVVQTAVGGWALQQQLSELGLNIDLNKDPKTQWFNTLWADNGDAMSKQYAGTAALKGDFTRTRKRNWTGALSDFGRSVNRYYNNIFGDYFLQTCIDYLLGNAGPAIFDEFEADMMSKDYALDMHRIRQSAIENCVKIVLEDPKEGLVAGWTLSCPHETNTLRTLPFEECVVLLTDAAFYFCRFDWDTEKVGGFERVELTDITELWRGAYITNALGPTHLDESKNVGFALRYKPSSKTVVRSNNRTLQNEEEAPGEKVENEDTEKKTESETEDNRLLAFKALPPDVSAAKDDREHIADMSEIELIKHICDILHNTMKTAMTRSQGFDHLKLNKIPQVAEKDVVSITDARKATGYMESIGYSLKRLVWS